VIARLHVVGIFIGHGDLTLPTGPTDTFKLQLMDRAGNGWQKIT
jgi:hypothetical protein